MNKQHKTLAVDFDGVIASYDRFRGKGKFGEPIGGCARVLSTLDEEGWIIIINTTRSETDLIEEYLKKYKIPYDHINYNPRNETLQLSPSKVVADVYLDDRAVCFEGAWNDVLLQHIRDFEPWHKRNSTKETSSFFKGRSPDGEREKEEREKRTVIQMLKEAIDIFQERDLKYGSSYKRFGKVMDSLFPQGTHIQGEREFIKLGLFIQIISKVTRYTNHFPKDSTSNETDSLKDLGVYSFMLEEIERDL